ncbi:hypothetical protein [Planctomonas deserti]|uniref:hypothetical protein n=1 Tax=Planctomonas deserti TaxID=2144185 RepID=UPI001F0C721D|nr:hypothetical protein [Planctomonas deserti]
MSSGIVAPGVNYWRVPLARAVLALALAAVTTFTAGHSPQFGLTVFGAFALLSGLVTAALTAASLTDRRLRSLFLVHGAVSVVVGLAALIGSSAGLLFYLYLVSVWAAVTGFLELYAGLRSRGRVAAAKDWLTVGAATALLALVFLLVPPDYAEAFTAADGVDGAVTASVLGVGLLGAYGALLGVYLIIAALSLKWAPAEAAAARGEK